MTNLVTNNKQRREVFGRTMADIIEQVGVDPEGLRKIRPTLDALSGAAGTPKEIQQVAKNLDTMEKAYKQLFDSGVTLEMSPAKYKSVVSKLARFFGFAKGAAYAAKGGASSPAAVANVLSALGKGYTSEERQIQRLQKLMRPGMGDQGVLAPPSTAQSLGAIGGAAAQQQNLKERQKK
jgi:hypothetical protein